MQFNSQTFSIRLKCHWSLPEGFYQDLTRHRAMHPFIFTSFVGVLAWVPLTKRLYCNTAPLTMSNQTMVIWRCQGTSVVLSGLTWRYGINNNASPSWGEAYGDRQLTPNFELWVEIFCVLACFPNEDSKIVSVRPFVCPYPEKKSHSIFVNISPTIVIDTSMERSSRVLQHGNPKFFFFFQKSSKLNFDLSRRAEITLVSSISVLHY